MTSDKLRFVTVNILEDEKCMKAYPKTYNPSTMICGGTLKVINVN
jgi:hypothetical protein